MKEVVFKNIGYASECSPQDFQGKPQPIGKPGWMAVKSNFSAASWIGRADWQADWQADYQARRGLRVPREERVGRG